ncbi:MAG: hypothetical protein R3253_02470, partial [Longimicrobiales bacterium]|nr:hypothetical protein [Longimicrobiales bacterium]
MMTGRNVAVRGWRWTVGMGMLALGMMMSGGSASSLAAQEKPTLTEDDYGKWERLGSATISPDGQWLAVAISRVNDENELRIHSTTS